MSPLRAIKYCSGYNLHLGKSLHCYLLEDRRIFRTRITQHVLFSMSISSSRGRSTWCSLFTSVAQQQCALAPSEQDEQDAMAKKDAEREHKALGRAH